MTLQTLTRGMRLLEAVADARGEASAQDLSERLDLKISTCYHLLRTLREEGHVVRLPDGRYDVGPRAVSLGRKLQERFRARPELSVILTRLHDTTRETSYLSGWARGLLTLQDHQESDRALRVGALHVGYTGNLHARASGKAVLAFLPAQTVEAMCCGVELPALTDATITDYDELVAELARVRRRGYAEDREEFTPGVRCVAAPFFVDDHRRPGGAFTVSVPASRFAESRDHLVRSVQEAAATASRLLQGGRLPVPVGDPGAGARAEVAR